MPVRHFLSSAAILLALGLSACNTSPGAMQQPVQSEPTRPRLVTDPNFRLPDGTSCTAAVNRFRALIDSDLQVGHTIASVHKEMSAEIDQAAASCAAGNDAGARAQILASRRRHGYPAY
jgi:hypothetical protein